MRIRQRKKSQTRALQARWFQNLIRDRFGCDDRATWYRLGELSRTQSLVKTAPIASDSSFRLGLGPFDLGVRFGGVDQSARRAPEPGGSKCEFCRQIRALGRRARGPPFEFECGHLLLFLGASWEKRFRGWTGVLVWIASGHIHSQSWGACRLGVRFWNVLGRERKKRASVYEK